MEGTGLGVLCVTTRLVASVHRYASRAAQLRAVRLSPRDPGVTAVYPRFYYALNGTFNGSRTLSYTDTRRTAVRCQRTLPRGSNVSG